MQLKTGTRIVTYSLLGAAAIASFMLPRSLGVAKTWGAQGAPPDVINLGGVVRDFTSIHPDFDITKPPDMGHAVGNVAAALGPDGRPVFTGNGQKVVQQWHDKDLNPIRPYAGPGLPGGHFDVDVYDSPSTSELYHEHQFDDTFDVTYVDVVNNPLLGGFDFNMVIGSTYPNDLRLEFFNVQNGGGGRFTFEAGGVFKTGNTRNGFTATFTPSTLTQLRVNFIALAALRPTEPGNSQGDAANRDGAFAIRMYDVVTNAMVYELAVYHHFKADEEILNVPVGEFDACGTAINDTAGNYANATQGAITDGGTFDQWFRDDLGTNLSARHSIALQRDAQGVYEYQTDAFFPADGQLLNDGSGPHNNFFTYSISATFTYSQCAGQFFEFESNDDAWVFIDDKLVIDLGGASTPDRQYVAMDRLGLVHGQEYTLKLFYAHRRDTLDSLFHMRTNLELQTNIFPTVFAAYD